MTAKDKDKPVRAITHAGFAEEIASGAPSVTSRRRADALRERPHLSSSQQSGRNGTLGTQSTPRASPRESARVEAWNALDDAGRAAFTAALVLDDAELDSED